MIFTRMDNPALRCGSCGIDDVETIYRKWVKGELLFYEIICKSCNNKLMLGFRRAGFHA
jgi:hypothetical protein